MVDKSYLVLVCAISFVAGILFSVWLTQFMIYHGRLPAYLRNKKDKMRALLEKEDIDVKSMG
jgi:hypothetical protein